MFKACFLNFFKNLKYVLVEMGVMYFALLLGFDYFFRKIGAGFEAFKEAFDQMMANEEPEMLIEGFTEIAEGFMQGAALFFIIQLLGLLVGYVLIMLFSRSEIERRNIFKVLLNAIVDGIILVVFIILLTWISSLASWGGILALLLFLPLYSAGTLFGSYVNHGLKAVTFKKAVSFRNIIKLSICNLLIVVATIVLALLCWAVFNVIIAIVLGISIFVVDICTISLNADSFVVALVAESNAKEAIIDAKDKAAKAVWEEFAKEKAKQEAKTTQSVDEAKKEEEIKDTAKEETKTEA